MELKDQIEEIKKEILREGAKYLNYDDVLDLTATIDTDGQIREISICKTWGGPTIWLDVNGIRVKIWGVWGSERYETFIFNEEIASEIFNKFAQLFASVEVKP